MYVSEITRQSWHNIKYNYMTPKARDNDTNNFSCAFPEGFNRFTLQ